MTDEPLESRLLGLITWLVIVLLWAGVAGAAESEQAIKQTTEKVFGADVVVTRKR